ncbi:hypothetical protein M5689_000783 [Euphorbia peplus]|nr:hypothetical protein M5689_000783 [Euphorbia peplus]
METQAEIPVQEPELRTVKTEPYDFEMGFEGVQELEEFAHHTVLDWEEQGYAAHLNTVMRMMMSEDATINSGRPLEDFGWENEHLGAKWFKEQGIDTDQGMNPPGTLVPQLGTWGIETYEKGQSSTSVTHMTLKREKN